MNEPLIERFDECDCTRCGLPAPLDESPEGDLVRYRDYEALRQQFVKAMQQLRANDDALGLSGVESRPQSMYIMDLQRQLAMVQP